MPIPNKRLVISKEDGITTEAIPRKTEKSAIFTKKNKKIGVMKFLSRRAQIQKKKATQRKSDMKRHQPFKHYKTKGSSFQFKRIETLVKNKHSQMKHWSQTMQRRDNRKYRQKLNEQLRGVSILLIVRIHRRKNIPTKLLSKLHNLRLLKPWDCIIIRNTPSLQLILKDILPFITFGIPTKEVIRDLVLKRGRLINVEMGNKTGNDNRSVIKSNVIVESILGKYGVICIEDIIHALSEVDDECVVMEDGSTMTKCDVFDGVANAINPFQLNSITIPMKGLKCPFNHLGYWGFRGTFINTFVEKII